ncbi:hypothetical protein LCGC14_0921260 [marine sediment metagenome]|uniref:Uncharacterized protein n=1 Tax=marine sediment metagenome TaxID=412755 RepID=A0A0F9NVK1_9ZZZZ
MINNSYNNLDILVMLSKRIYYWLLIPIDLIKIFKFNELNKVLFIYFIICEKGFTYKNSF